MATENQLYFMKEWNRNLWLMVATALISIIFAVDYALKKWKQPPGPTGLPLIGNLLDVCKAGTVWGKTLHAWSREYGDVYKIRYLGQWIYVINKYEKMVEFLTHPALQTRVPPITNITALGPGSGLTLGGGPTWQAIHTLVAEAFSKLGVGQSGSKFESILSTEAERLVEEFEKVSSKSTSVSNQILCSSLNVVMGFLFGKQIAHSEQEMFANSEVNSKFFSLSGPGAINLTSHVLATIPFGPGQRVIHVIRWIVKVWTKNVEAHKTMVQNDIGEERPIQDFVDLFVRKIYDSKGTEESKIFKEANLYWVLKDFHFNAVEPIASSLQWAILFLAMHPEAQTKCQTEIEEVIEGSRKPCWADRNKTPYLTAALVEISRLGAVATFSDYRSAESDCVIDGYAIPRGAKILCNWYSHFTDPDYWSEPLLFKPERFLDEDGKFIKSHVLNQYGMVVLTAVYLYYTSVLTAGQIIPVFSTPDHSTGKRSCLGKEFAEMELYVLLSNLLHRLTFSMPEDSAGGPLSLEDAVYGYTRAPAPFKVTIKKRD